MADDDWRLADDLCLKIFWNKTPKYPLHLSFKSFLSSKSCSFDVDIWFLLSNSHLRYLEVSLAVVMVGCLFFFFFLLRSLRATLQDKVLSFFKSLTGLMFWTKKVINSGHIQSWNYKRIARFAINTKLKRTKDVSAILYLRLWTICNSDWLE